MATQTKVRLKYASLSLASVLTTHLRLPGAFRGHQLALALTILAAGCHPFTPGPPPAAGSGAGGGVAITGALILPMDRDTALLDHTLVAAGGRIRAIGPTRTTPVPRGYQVIDGRGAVLIPGLWDMHVHALTEDRAAWILPKLVGHGVTGVRDMWGSMAVARRARPSTAAIVTPVPRFLLPGHILDGPYPAIRGAIAVASPARAGPIVDSLAASGADFLKVYSLLPRSTYLAILDAAKIKGLAVDGHVPTSVRIADASTAGHRTMEHLVQFDFECSGERAALQAYQREIFMRARADSTFPFASASDSLARRLHETFSTAVCRDLIRTLARNRTWQTPTLVAHRGALLAYEDAITQDPRIREVPEAERAQWEDTRVAARRMSNDQRDLARRRFTRFLEIVRLMHEEGVPLLAGSDIMNPFTIPGASLHDELELLVQAGLPPYEALKTATYNPAVMLGATDSLGSLRAGQVADVLMLSADPRRDVRATRLIRGALLRGNWYSAARLRALRAPAAIP